MTEKISGLPNTGKTGILSIEKLKSIPGFTKEEDLNNNLVAVIECDQDIPCNPCEDICPKKAIWIGEPITNLPSIDIEKCNGCLSCLGICPGLCIFAIKKDFSVDDSLVYLPYEYLPVPVKGAKVKALDRKGDFVCFAKIHKIISLKKSNKTNIVGLIIPKEYVNIVRNFEL